MEHMHTCNATERPVVPPTETWAACCFHKPAEHFFRLEQESAQESTFPTCIPALQWLLPCLITSLLFFLAAFAPHVSLAQGSSKPWHHRDFAQITAPHALRFSIRLPVHSHAWPMVFYDSDAQRAAADFFCSYACSPFRKHRA